MQDSDIPLLRIFIAIVQSNGFSGAQAALNIGASTISEHMSRLENSLGVKLCHRGRGGFRLTSHGEVVYDSAQRLLAAIEGFKQETGELKNMLCGEFRIGVIGNTVTDKKSPTSKALNLFTSREGTATFKIEIGSPIELEQQVLDGRLHIGIGTFPTKVPGLEYKFLYEEDEGLYCSTNHPLYQLENITLPDIQKYDLVARGYMRAKDIQIVGSKVTSAMTENVEAQAMLILTGRYIGLLPNHYADYWVKKGELCRVLPEEIKPSSTFEYITKERKWSSFILNAFIEDLESAVKLKTTCEKGNNNE